MNAGNAHPSPRLPWTLVGNLAVVGVLVAAACLLLPLHGDDWWPAPPLPGRWAWAGGVLSAWLLASATFLRPPRTQKAVGASVDDSPPLLVAWASQTGFAQVLAERSAAMLREGGVPVVLLPLEAVDLALLARTRRALFLASTTGEGDPPDHALAFLRDTLSQSPALGSLEYAVLALGDHEYEDFCAFGRQLDQWLHVHGARALFDRVDVDNADPAALRHWQDQVGRIGGLADVPDWVPPDYESWTLRSRTWLNPGSPGAPVFDLALVPANGTALPQWQAGDIAEIEPHHPQATVRALLEELQLSGQALVDAGRGHEPLAGLLARMRLPEPALVRGLPPQALVRHLQPLPHREYSIASLPVEGSLRLLVRRMAHADGRPGLGSGWLCEGAAVEDDIRLRLRPNPGFHPPAPDRPLVLVGNGTGIATLRAHLQARITAGARDNWLLFGERSPDHDRPYGDELRQWQARGWLDRLDLAFSRDPGDPAYVQDRLRAAAGILRDWIDRGATILVCGSATGMAPAVDEALAGILGEHGRDTLRSEGRYRRDVY